MAVALKDLIDINLLDYYDEQVKTWVVNKIADVAASVEITTESELPAEGEIGKLYVTKDSIVTWDDVNKKYVPMGGSSSESTDWAEM